MKLRMAHSSLQFSDTSSHHQADVRKLFSQNFDTISGTEAGPGSGNTPAALRKYAAQFGYELSLTKRYDSWVAVKGTLIKPGTWDKGAEFALWRSSRRPVTPPGRWGDKGLVWGEFYNEEIGWVSLGAIHALTEGGAGKVWKKASDRIYATVMGNWAKEQAAGKRLALVSGDFNMGDRGNDLFLGQSFTTCWDELKTWPGTGHGNIDAFASWDKDFRVKCIKAKAYEDNEFFLNSDHNLITATYDIKSLNEAKK